MTLARAGEGSLAGTLVTASGELAREFILGAARAHGRIQVLNEESSAESTGHGSPLPQLVPVARDVRAAAKSWADCAR
ncbi:hypothetical protein ACLK1Y_07720 [Escherichia coli]